MVRKSAAKNHKGNLFYDVKKTQQTHLVKIIKIRLELKRAIARDFCTYRIGKQRWLRAFATCTKYEYRERYTPKFRHPAFAWAFKEGGGACDKHKNLICSLYFAKSLNQLQYKCRQKRIFKLCNFLL